MKIRNSRLILAVALCMSLCACGSTKQAQMPEASVVPNTSVKTVLAKKIRTTYNTADDNEDSSQSVTTIYSYDDRGLLISEKQETNGLTSMELVYTYDENGNLLSAKNLFGSYYCNYTYDDEGRVLTRESGENGCGITTILYTYDDAGRVQAEQETKVDDDIQDETTTITTYVYDGNGRTAKTTEVCRGTEGVRYLWSKIYSYVGETDLVEQEVYTYSGTVSYIETSTYTYDATGQLLSKKVTDQEGNTATQEYAYTYDSAGNVLTEECVQNGGFSTTWRTDIIEHTYRNSRSRGTTTKTYDSRGNELTSVRTDTYQGGQQKSEQSTTYDDNNRIIKTMERFWLHEDDRNHSGRTETTYEYTEINVTP